MRALQTSRRPSQRAEYKKAVDFARARGLTDSAGEPRQERAFR